MDKYDCLYLRQYRYCLAFILNIRLMVNVKQMQKKQLNIRLMGDTYVLVNIHHEPNVKFYFELVNCLRLKVNILVII